LKPFINLLPWREKRHIQQCQRCYWQLLGFFTLVGGIVFINSLFNGYFQRNIATEQKQLHPIKDKLAQQTQQLSQQQKRYIAPQSQPLLSAVQTQEILQILTALPFQQGALEDCQFLLSEQKPYFQLQGYAHTQDEFEQLHQYLNAQLKAENVQLSQFMPKQNQQLQFEFRVALP